MTLVFCYALRNAACPCRFSSEVLECRPAARLCLTELRRSPTTHRPRLRLANRPTPPLTLRRQRARPSFRTRGTLRCHPGRRAKRAEPGSIYPGGADGTRRVCQRRREKWIAGLAAFAARPG